ncbi:MAG: hypothetical protein ACOC0C_03525 [Bacteroidota bacterium]
MQHIFARIFIDSGFFLFLLFILPQTTFSQGNPTPILERKISIKVDVTPVPSILATIADKGNFVFSYNPELVQSLEPRSIDIQDMPVRHALHALFEDDIHFRERGNYVILKEDNPSKKNNPEKPTYIIEGYISEAGTGKKLTETTVYSEKTRQAAITDEYGFFRLEVTSDTTPELNVVKAGFRDTLIAPISTRSYLTVNLATQKNQDKFSLKTTGNEQDISAWSTHLVKKNVLINTRNISSTFFSAVQISLAPYLSTNKLLTGNTVNNVSINTTIGYVQGVQYFEVGGIFNLVRNDAAFFQAAGVGNIVGNKCLGLQAAGVLNLSRDLSGAQVSGVFNISRNDAQYFQAAGVGNIVAGESTGVQAAGVFNTSKDGTGAQFSGVFNHNKTFAGGQVAGVFNTGARVKGFQAAGLFNRSREFSGVQISGLFNSTETMRGASISIINLADSCIGVPIGLFNFIKNGYHSIEISTNELLMVNASFRSGIDKFYTIINAGANPGERDNPFWMFGFGIGTRLNAKGTYIYNADIIRQQVIHGKFETSDNTLTKLYVGVERKILPKVCLAGGLTYNFFSANTEAEEYETLYSDIGPYTFSSKTFENGYNLKTWPGFTLALRFSWN